MLALLMAAHLQTSILQATDRLRPPRAVVDKIVLATKIAAIRDAVARIKEVRPTTADAFLATAPRARSSR